MVLSAPVGRVQGELQRGCAAPPDLPPRQWALPGVGVRLFAPLILSPHGFNPRPMTHTHARTRTHARTPVTENCWMVAGMLWCGQGAGFALTGTMCYVEVIDHGLRTFTLRRLRAPDLVTPGSMETNPHVVVARAVSRPRYRAHGHVRARTHATHTHRWMDASKSS
jgi:hypothetical protein